MRVVRRSEYVPHVGCETPVPDWKSAEWARDVLPEQDPARIRSPRQRVGVATRTKEEAS